MLNSIKDLSVGEYVELIKGSPDRCTKVQKPAFMNVVFGKITESFEFL